MPPIGSTASLHGINTHHRTPANPTTLEPVTEHQPSAPHRQNVESFNLDHRIVAAPFVRQADRKVLPHGDVLVKYDLRFAQPNEAHLEMPAVHSLEHLFAEKVRDHSDAVIDFSPMGCQTGFYLILQGEPAYDEVLALIETTLRDVLTADAVPAANETQCGWAASHTLEGAKAAASAFLAERAHWPQVFRTGAP